jgi:hypothetical protein
VGAGIGGLLADRSYELFFSGRPIVFLKSLLASPQAVGITCWESDQRGEE